VEHNQWWTIKDQSLAVYMRNAGFDLAVYSNYSKSVQDEARKWAIKASMDGIKNAFEELSGYPLYDICEGVYVISLSSPLSVDYQFRWSPVIYIGLGNVVNRIKSHFDNSLFAFMESLSGANFDFSFASPHKPYHTDYYKHVEYQMLEYFSQKIGGIDDKKRYPILNKNAGANKNIKEDEGWWTTPLKATGRRPYWALKPTEHSDFASLD
jgi:hypothetical protein